MLAKFGLAAIGEWSTLLACASILKIFDFAASSTITLLVKEVTFNSSKRKIETIFWTYILICLLSWGACFSIAIYFLKGWLSFLNFNQPIHVEIFVWGAIGVAISSFSLNLVAVYDGIHRFETKFVVISISNICYLAFLVSFSDVLNVLVIPIAFCFQYLIQSVLLLILMDRRQVDLLRKIEVDLNLIAFAFHFSMKTQLSNILFAFIEPAVKMAIQINEGARIVGLFDLANQIVQKLRAFATGVLQNLFPVVPQYSSFNSAELRNIYLTIFRFTLFFTLSTGTMLILFTNIVSGMFGVTDKSAFLAVFFPLVLCNMAGLLVTPAYFINFSQSRAGQNLAYHLAAVLILVALFTVSRLINGALNISIVNVYSASMIVASCLLIISFHKRCELNLGRVFWEDSTLLVSSVVCIFLSWALYSSQLQFISSDVTNTVVPFCFASLFIFFNRHKVKTIARSMLVNLSDSRL